jgi:VanZ family protein
LSKRTQTPKLRAGLNTRARLLVSYWMPALAWMLVIFLASSDLGSAQHTSRFLVPLLRWIMPNVDLATLASAQFLVRKAAHVTEYAILGALLLRAFSASARRPWWHYAGFAVAVAAGFAALDEFHQSFVGSRTGSPYDVLIDISGALLGLALWTLLAKWRNSRRSAPAAA